MTPKNVYWVDMQSRSLVKEGSDSFAPSCAWRYTSEGATYFEQS